MTMLIAEVDEFAARASELRWARLPSEVRTRANEVVADTVGVAIGATPDPFLTQLAGLSGTGGEATVLSSGQTMAAADAAGLNAAACTVTQFDEGLREARGHPGIHVVPASIAVAEQRHLDGRSVLAAVVAGYEVASRVGRYLGPPRDGIHPHGGWGTIGAAVSVAILAGADASRIVQAIEGAAALALTAPDKTATQGADTHHLYAYHGARMGLLIGLAAADGMTAGRGHLAHYAERASAGSREPRALCWSEDDDHHYEILNGYLKPAPVCAHTLTALDCLDRLPDNLSAGNVQRIEVRCYAGAVALSERAPASVLACRFSIPYVLAAAVSGNPDLLLHPDPHNQSIRLLASRIEVVHDPRMDSGYPDGRPVEVTVQLTGGTSHTARATTFEGDRERPWPADRLTAKVASLTKPTLGPAGARRLLSSLAHFEEIEDIHSVVRSWRTAQGGGRL